MDQVWRKTIRLPAQSYDAGWYFVTICTENRKNILAKIEPIVGADDSVRPCVALQGYAPVLTQAGVKVKTCLERLNDEEQGIRVDSYVIMPNHIHAIIFLDAEKGGQSRPPLQRLMQRFKSISKRQFWELGFKTLWQRSFYDHVIRSEKDYLGIRQYIDDNPAGWAEDEYYYAE